MQSVYLCIHPPILGNGIDTASDHWSTGQRCHNNILHYVSMPDHCKTTGAIQVNSVPRPGLANVDYRLQYQFEMWNPVR